MDQRWWWALGAAGLVGGGAVATILLWPKPASASPSTPPAPSPSGIDQTITLAAGAIGLPAKPGANITLNLPAGATWLEPIAGAGALSIGSAPSSGSNPASFVYNGGGAEVIAEWTLGGVTAAMTITLTDA